MRKVLVALIAALVSLPVLADVTGLVSPPGGGGGSSLPTQTGNSGKFLTTDGTSASWASPTASASSVTPGTTTVVGSTAPCLIDNSATTVMGCLAETGTGSAVLATSPTLVTPNLGTPSAINLTNAAALPATALPALTGDVTSSAGSNSVTVSKVNGATPPTSAFIGGWNSAGQPIAMTEGSNTIPCNATGSTGVPTACSALTALGVLSSTAAVPETASYTPTDASNANGEYTMGCSAACTFTVPPSIFSVGNSLTIEATSTGVVSIAAGSGVTINYPGNLSYVSLGGEGGVVQLQETATNVWEVRHYAYGAATFTVGGTCTESAIAGGNTGGTYTLSSAGNCTIIVTPGGGLTARDFWVGTMGDQSQLGIPLWTYTSSTTTTITFTAPTAAVSTDKLTFHISPE